MMKKKVKQVSQRLCLCIVLGAMYTVIEPSLVLAQDRYPREYTNPNEIVAFDRSTSYPEAIEVINQFYQEYRNKFIIDQTGTDGAIGVSLPAMHWEDALAFILRLKGLTVLDNEEFVEIIRQSDAPGAEPEPVVEVNNRGIDLNTREVRINATFFEGNRTALQEIGVDWSTLTNDVPDNINELVAGSLTSGELGVPQSDFSNQFVSVNQFGASSVSENVFNALVNLGEIGAGISVQALFSAFEADNLGEILATPFTKVLDGQEGRVQVGQDFSIKQRDIAGNVTDEFFSTGTILTVTPHVININDTSFIHLIVDVERSSASPNEVSTIINKEEASTQALLLDGEATTIAGLYSTNESVVRRGVPILKDLPGWFFGLRYLFGYNSTDYSESELIIIVQASFEETLTERASKKFKNKQTVLDEARADSRSTMERVFDNELATDYIAPIKETPITDFQEIPVTEVEEQLVSPADEVEASDLSSSDVELSEEIIGEESVDVTAELETDELTEEQKQLAAELSMPVDNPELMVVVPRAFSLDEYLTGKQNGEEVEDVNSSNLKYFVIGGSFIVKNNANRFNQNLEEQGYITRVLFHPSSRFNFVAYQGFSKFDDAVDYLKSIRADVNSESWLFVLPTK